MAVTERERVLALSPDAASTAAAQRLAVATRWTSLGCTRDLLWGRCQGSGRTPYETVVGLGAAMAFGCSCPSRKAPCKHVLALLILSTGGGVPTSREPADFAAQWLRRRSERPSGPARPARETAVRDPEAAAKRAAARVDRVDAGLDDLERGLHDQIRGGLAGVERAGYAHFDRVAARMVDAQAPGVASMLRAIPAELAVDGWPERVLDRLAALHLLIQAHRRIDLLPDELAANVRSRVGYPVPKVEVLASPAVRDQWLVLGSVDTVEYQLETRRVWLHGTTSRRWALSLSFAVPGQSLDSSVLPGQLSQADVHFYPGSGYRAVVEVLEDPQPLVASAPAETFSEAQHRFAQLLGVDPWATRMPAVLSVAPVRPQGPGEPWRLRDRGGRCRPVVGAGDLWPLLARSCGELVDVFGEWEDKGIRPLSVLPDGQGSPFRAEVSS